LDSANGTEGKRIQVCPQYVDGKPGTGWSSRLFYLSDELLILRGPIERPGEFHYASFFPDDIMTERYWFGCWYNVFTVHDAAGQLKGWYANVCLPPSFDGDTVRYTDLDLDLWVWPDRRYVILDEDEFEARVVPSMPPHVVRRAWAVLADLLADLEANGPLFRDPIPLD
jgi:hypothetical protein